MPNAIRQSSPSALRKAASAPSPAVAAPSAVSPKLMRVPTASFGGLKRWNTSSLSLRADDLKHFFPNVVRRVRALQLAKTDLRVRLLLVFEEWTLTWPSVSLHSTVGLMAFTGTVLLVLLTTIPRSSPDRYQLAFADFVVGCFLLTDWLARVILSFGLAFASDEKVRSLTPRMRWLLIDGLSSWTHVITALCHMNNLGDERTVNIVACMRITRLVSLSRYSSVADLVLDVLWQSSNALKGPMYFLAVSTVCFGTIVFYAELLMAGPDIAAFDTLGNAIWYGWVTFSTVGYGDFSPNTWLGKVIATHGIVMGMVWFAMPITVVGSTFKAEWDRRNVRVIAEALQTELLENGQMSSDLVRAAHTRPSASIWSGPGALGS